MLLHSHQTIRAYQIVKIMLKVVDATEGAAKVRICKI